MYAAVRLQILKQVNTLFPFPIPIQPKPNSHSDYSDVFNTVISQQSFQVMLNNGKHHSINSGNNGNK